MRSNREHEGASPFYVILFVVLLLLAGSFQVMDAEAASKQGANRPAAEDQTDENVVLGYGRTADAARERAIDKAKDRVKQLLQRRFATPDWEPPAEQLGADVLVSLGVVQAVNEPEPGPILGEENSMVARYTVKLTDDYLAEVRRVAVHDRIEQRHLMTARVLIGILALLLTTVGYLRMEEWTRGYATKLLRLAAVVILATVGLGLYLTL